MQTRHVALLIALVAVGTACAAPDLILVVPAATLEVQPISALDVRWTEPESVEARIASVDTHPEVLEPDEPRRVCGGAVPFPTQYEVRIYAEVGPRQSSNSDWLRTDLVFEEDIESLMQADWIRHE